MATPGAVVGNGALVTPGGAQGPQGIQGPIGPQGPPGTGGGGPPALHAPTHISGGTDPISTPTASTTGLCPALPATPTGKYLDATLNWTAPPGGVAPSRQILTGGSLTGGGDLSADRTLALSGDSASPGNTKLYGTNALGVKGWYTQPATGASVNTLASIQGDGSVGAPVQLVGDNPTPGANKYYGTDGSGSRGWIASGTVGNLTTQQSIAIDGNAPGVGGLSTNHTINLVNDTATPNAYQLYGVNSAGARGWQDLPFSTYNTATFAMPAAGAAVAGVAINAAPWIQVGMILNIGTAGKMRVTAKASNTSITLLNTGATGNAVSAATIPVNQFFALAGYIDRLDATSSIVGVGTEDSGFKLSGDAATPGNSMLYGTNASGVKGWYVQPTGGGTTVSVTNSVTGDGSAGNPLKLSGDSGSPGNSMLYGTNASGVKGWYAQPAGGGGTGTKTYAKFTPLTAQPPASNFPAFAISADNRAYLAFNDTTAQATSWADVMPESASLASGLIVRIYWAAASAITGAVVWKAEFDKLASAITDSYDTAGSVTTTVPGTAGNIAVTSITITTIDSIVADDAYFFRLTRDAANAADTAIGDAWVLAVEIKSAA